jgi:two-component system CheB/CheR fusion protein
MVVSETLELLHVSGEARTYLRFPPGKLVNDVSKLAHKDLAIPLTTGLQKVSERGTEVTYSNIHLRSEDDDRIVNMRLKPLPTKKGQSLLIAVLIEEVRRDAPARPASAQSYDVGREAQQRIIDLENELQFTRENLQAMVEELETSNEELQASNEELLASNEELQSTNEELQSVNEELYTVNSEHQSKITELTEANNDLDNLLQNTRVATLFADENLEIRRFTPEITRLFRVIDQDIGRPLGHLAHDLRELDLEALSTQVTASNIPLEREILNADGDKYLMRIFPYQIGPTDYSGVVITFVNISGLRQVQFDLAERETRMDALLDAIPDGYLLMDEEGQIQEVNPALTSLLGYEAAELLGRDVSILLPRELAAEHGSFIRRYLRSGDANIIGQHRRVSAIHKDGSTIPLVLTVTEMLSEDRRAFVGLFRPPVRE